MIEKIIFNILAFSLFIIMFFIMARKNDTKYIILLIAEAIGITINFLELTFNIFVQLPFKILEYILAIVLPIAILIIERKGISFAELITILQDMYYKKVNKNEKRKEAIFNLLNKYPESIKGHKMLARLYEEEEEFEKAIDEYARVVSENTEEYQTFYKIAFLLKKVDKKEEAKQTLNALLEQKPDYYEATELLGDILCEQELYKDAINIYMNSLKYYPEKYEIYYNLGMIYICLNDFQNAQTCYNKAAQINSKLYNAYYTLGKISLIYNDIEQAEKYFTESLYGESIEAEAYFELAKIYMLKNQKEMAITFLTKAIEIDQNYVKIGRNEPIFIPIKQYIKVPEEVQEINREPLSEKEQKVLEKLSSTIEVVEKIGYKEREQQLEKEKEQEENKNIDLTI